MSENDMTAHITDLLLEDFITKMMTYQIVNSVVNVDDTVPVSYTHLDVYKRQRYYCAHSSGF